MIFIIDYGMANLRSVQKGFEKVGCAAIVGGTPEGIARADRLVLPGVGAFRDAIARLRETHLDEPILEHIRAGKPFLGICLGLQLLFTKSWEDGEHAGLGVFAGEVKRFDNRANGLKVPHMGWNALRQVRPAPLFRGVPDGSCVYYVHSYYAVPAEPDLVAGESDYPHPFASVIWRDNVQATQFHPEKSQQMGLRMLHNFATHA